MPAGAVLVTANFVPVTHTLTVVNGVGSGSFAAGTVVNITANTPPAGQVFSSWTISGGGSVANANSAATTFTMPAGAVTATANFVPVTHRLTVVNGTGGGDFAAGTVVTIRADSPARNQVFHRWSITSGSGSFANSNRANTTFTMPASAVTVRANFVSEPPPPGRGSGGSGGTIGTTAVRFFTPVPIIPADRWLTASDVTAIPRVADGSIRSTHGGRFGVRGAAWASFGSAYTHDTTDARGVQVRTSINNPRAMRGDVRVSAWVSGNDVDSSLGIFGRWFRNDVRVVHFDHPDEWGQTIRVAARVDFTGMSTGNLYFYSYDRGANTFRRIANPNHRIDGNGFIHFNTDMGGSIIISNGPLVRR